MQRETKRARPSRSITRSGCWPNPVCASAVVMGGGAKAVPQPLRSTRQMSAMAKIKSFLMSETDPKNRPQLKIRLTLCVRGLRKSGDCYKPISTAIRDVRTNEEISYVSVVAPLRKDKFVQQFYARGDARREFIACPKRLAEFALALGQIVSYPNRFECSVISQDKRPEIFLRDHFRLQLDQSIACS